MVCSIALPSKLCAALHGQSNVGSIRDCEPCRSLDLTVLVEIDQELTVTMVQVSEGTALSTQGQHYVQYKEGQANHRRSFKLSCCKLDISS